jgi:hypothetical protein
MRVLWNRLSVATLLSNPTQMGVMPYEGKEIPDMHPAIISHRVFNRVQVIRQRRCYRQAVYSPRFRVYL